MELIDQFNGYLGKFYLLEEDENGFPHQILEIEEKDYKMLLEISKQLYEFRYFQRKAFEMQLNNDDYFRLINYYEKALFNALNEKERDLTLETAFVDINRVFINFVSSLKSFLEHFETRLKKKYKVGSDVIEKFKQFNSANYDKMLAHRLLVNLRNYAQHQDFPIDDIGFVIDYKDEKAIGAKLTPSFNKEKLLNSLISKKIETDLHLMNVTFPVAPHMIEIQKFIKELLEKIIEIEFHNLKNAAQVTMEYFSKTNKRQDAKIGYLKKERVGFSWNQTQLEVQASQLLLSKINNLDFNK